MDDSLEGNGTKVGGGQKDEDEGPCLDRRRMSQGKALRQMLSRERYESWSCSTVTPRWEAVILLGIMEDGKELLLGPPSHTFPAPIVPGTWWLSLSGPQCPQP